jgi:hypothetical protein
VIHYRQPGKLWHALSFPHRAVDWEITADALLLQFPIPCDLWRCHSWSRVGRSGRREPWQGNHGRPHLAPPPLIPTRLGSFPIKSPHPCEGAQQAPRNPFHCYLACPAMPVVDFLPSQLSSDGNKCPVLPTDTPAAEESLALHSFIGDPPAVDFASNKQHLPALTTQADS